jgi:hypothetical protein
VIVIPDTVLVTVMRKPVLIGSSLLFEMPPLVLADKGASGCKNTVPFG